MDLNEILNLSPCPICGGASYLEEEGELGVYVVCTECGSQTVVLNGKNAEDKVNAARKVEDLWNSGKAISTELGE